MYTCKNFKKPKPKGKYVLCASLLLQRLDNLLDILKPLIDRPRRLLLQKPRPCRLQNLEFLPASLNDSIVFAKDNCASLLVVCFKVLYLAVWVQLEHTLLTHVKPVDLFHFALEDGFIRVKFCDGILFFFHGGLFLFFVGEAGKHVFGGIHGHCLDTVIYFVGFVVN